MCAGRSLRPRESSPDHESTKPPAMDAGVALAAPLVWMLEIRGGKYVRCIRASEVPEFVACHLQVSQNKLKTPILYNM